MAHESCSSSDEESLSSLEPLSQVSVESVLDQFGLTQQALLKIKQKWNKKKQRLKQQGITRFQDGRKWICLSTACQSNEHPDLCATCQAMLKEHQLL